LGRLRASVVRWRGVAMLNGQGVNVVRGVPFPSPRPSPPGRGGSWRALRVSSLRLGRFRHPRSAVSKEIERTNTRRLETLSFAFTDERRHSLPLLGERAGVRETEARECPFTVACFRGSEVRRQSNSASRQTTGESGYGFETRLRFARIARIARIGANSVRECANLPFSPIHSSYPLVSIRG
jgi:hypothetical protein